MNLFVTYSVAATRKAKAAFLRSLQNCAKGVTDAESVTKAKALAQVLIANLHHARAPASLGGQHRPPDQVTTDFSEGKVRMSGIEIDIVGIVVAVVPARGT